MAGDRDAAGSGRVEGDGVAIVVHSSSQVCRVKNGRTGGIELGDEDVVAPAARSLVGVGGGKIE